MATMPQSDFECGGVVRLFPLGSVVLFPFGLLPLHIFEPRYRQMTADALASDRAIAMALPLGTTKQEPVPIHSIADPLHVNTVKVLTPEMAAALPGTKAGQVLLSLRNIGAVIVVDPETETTVWALRGPWYGQHDPDILPNGNMLIFDNVGNFLMPNGKSRVLEIDPRTAGIVWSYVGTRDKPFDSDIRADQQRLANGNTLINESNGGRMFEVTPAGEIVWEFVNPIRRGDDDEWIPIIAGAAHVEADFFEPGLF